ncbi:hypothetical protein ACFWIB_15505 [Streptomyces sp. NPDC127051]|uniref:hypothetical protein n=1 Tax=Streptomyces sp. NPDC127051 TaxID=3347119 RepID=UPI003657542C
MNTSLVNTAAGVIHAAMEQGRSLPQALAYALESAQLLQSPESAAELYRLREQLREALAGAGVADELYREWMRRAETAEARVAELEAERHSTNEALSDAAEQLRRDRDRIATLEAERTGLVADRDAQIVEWLGKKAREYGYSNAEKRAKADAVARMADKLSRGAVRRPHEDGYVSPLDHDYRFGRDLPEMPRG